MPEIPHQRLKVFDSADRFLKDSRDLLYSKEDLNNTILATAEKVALGEEPFTGPYWFAKVTSTDGEDIGCAIHANPDGLIIVGLDRSLSDTLFQAVNDAIGQPKRVIASPDLASDLAGKWIHSSGSSVELENLWRVYRIDKLSDSSAKAAGEIRKGEPGEQDLVKRWGDQYAREKPAFISVASFFSRKLTNGELFIWDDDGAKSLVTLSSRTRNGIKISGVYTPPEYRGQGYAGAAVRAICEDLFDNGVRFVTLNTQAGDPVERLYERIGFYVIGSQKSITFSQDSGKDGTA